MLRTSKKRLGGFLAVAALLVFLSVIGVLRPVESIFTKIYNPIAARFYALSATIRQKYNEQTDKSDLANQVKNLETEINRLSVANANLQSLAQENAILRQQLGFVQKNKYRYVTANVIARGDITDGYTTTDTITLDKGASDGLYPGLAVIIGDGVIVGKITEVKDNIAKADLTNNQNCKLAAVILDNASTNGIAQGMLGLTIDMGFIPQGVPIKTDDLVVTSGLEKSIPRGLVIGRVVTVNQVKDELWQDANLEPLSDPDNLIIVTVLLP